MKPLYEISNNYLEALDGVVIDEETGEIIDITGNLPAVRSEFELGAKRLGMAFDSIDASVEAIKKVEARMYKRRKSLEASSQRIKNYLLGQMKRTGINSISCEYFKISPALKPPSVKIYNEKLVPDLYINVETVEKIDKAAIKKAIQEGKEVPGAKLEQGERIKIS